MTDPGPNPEKPVDEWVTGDEPMTGPQRSYLETLAREAGAEVPDTLTKAEASEMIDRLRRTTGRGDPARSDGKSSHDVPGQLPLVDDLAEQGIVDQQAATDVTPRDERRAPDRDDRESDEWIDETMAEGDIANGEGDPDARPARKNTKSS
jgi:hypothetical protein